MSTPQTLSHPLPPHQYLDHRERYLPSPQNRYLPPPRPSSNLSNSFHHSMPARPSSNVSTQQLPLPPPPRPNSGMSSAGYTHSHAHSPAQARGGAEQSYSGSRLTQQSSHEDLRRVSSTASQHRKPLPPLPNSGHAPQSVIPPPATEADVEDESTLRGKKRGRRSPVDWVEYFGGKPPAEIITIHDDDSPAPPASIQRLPPPTNGSSASHHVDKKRRTNGGSGGTVYSETNTPYSLSHGASTDSLQATTAGTSLGSQASSNSRLDNTQTGQKRKRNARAAEPEPKRHAADYKGPRGYLAGYGEYCPPKQQKKCKDVQVSAIHDRARTNDKIDDDDGHYIIKENSRLGERYNLVHLLGQGTFGKVVKALDLKSRAEVAVKIIRAVPKYRDASRIELRVLQTLRTADEHNLNRCIQLKDCFDWRGHICIVTPLLGQSVFDFLKLNSFVPFPNSHIQAFAYQLLKSISFLHDLNLIHTDLKPENILLLDHQYQAFTYNRNVPSSSTLNQRRAQFRRVLLQPQINLIDFGSATFDDEYHSSVVSTRHYRAPEIILGIGWSHPIDLWSLGCILVECWTGDALFQTHDCCEHLAMMEAVTGNAIDKALIREVSRTSKRNDRNAPTRFFKNGNLAYPLADTPRQSRKFVRAMKRLEEIVPPNTDFNRLFLDLLRQIFVYDPKKRITAREALKHPWFQELVEDDGTEAGRIGIEKAKLAREAEERISGKRR